MTAIAYRDGIMAADTASWSGSVIVGHTNKIIRLSDGRLFGASGATSAIHAAAEWLSGIFPPLPGASRPTFEEGDLCALLVGPQIGDVLKIEA